MKFGIKIANIFACFDENSKDRYYVVIFKDDGTRISTDFEISNIIGISREEYTNILIKYNAEIIDDECYFEKEENCLECIEYFNELYEVVLMLLD